MNRMLFSLGLIAILSAMAVAKSGPTLHTRDEIALAREQARDTDWGRANVAALLARQAGSYSTLTAAGCWWKARREKEACSQSNCRKAEDRRQETVDSRKAIPLFSPVSF